MRIIGGELKGRVLKSKLPQSVRPTTDMARETLFNVLDNLIDYNDISFLDLFTGSGLVGIEALSRGTDYVHFNDISMGNITNLKNNLVKLSLNTGFEITKKNFKSILKDDKKYDVVFADPPYDKDLYNDILKLTLEHKKLNKNGILILEARTNQFLNVSNLKVIKEKKVGSSKLIFLQNHLP